MQLSKSRHNLFAKQDHDKIYIETNYVPPKPRSAKSKELNYNVRKMLANSDLNVKLATKSPVITASSLQKYDDEGVPFDDSRDGASSVASNHSDKLTAFKEALSKKVGTKLNLSLTAEQLENNNDQGLVINDDDDDLNDIFERDSLVSEQVEHDDLSDEDGDEVGQMKPSEPLYSSTLEVHRSFMKEKQSTDTLRAIQLVESLKVLAPPADVNLAEFGSRKLAVVSDSPSQKSDKKQLLNDTASVASTAAGGPEALGLSPIGKSFLFLSKLANARNQPADSPLMESARHGIKGKAVNKSALPQINKAVMNYMSEMITGDDMSVASSTNKVDYDLPVYEATPLKNVHQQEGKTLLKMFDKAFAALTFQRKEPVIAPEAKGIPVLKLKSLFDQEELVSAHLTRTEAKDDEQFYKALREHVDKKKAKAKQVEEDKKNAPPTAHDIVSNISQYLENKKPPLPLKSALKQSKYEESSSGTHTPSVSPEKNIYKTYNPSPGIAGGGNPTPLLDLSKMRQPGGGVLSPIGSTTPSVYSESNGNSPIKFPAIGSPPGSSAADGRKQLTAVSGEKPPLFSSGRYSQAFSPEVQRYVSDTYQQRDPHLKGISSEEQVEEEEEDGDDDLVDLKVARLESRNNSPSETDKYRYQHSTNSYVLKGEVNHSQYGLHSRHPPHPDGWSGNGEGTIQFSERHLKAIEETTVGNTPAVIYIPATNKHAADASAYSTRPAGETVLFSPNSSMHSMSGYIPNSNSRAAVELHAGTTVKTDAYSGVSKQLNYTNSAHSLHSSSLPQLKSAASGFSVANSVASNNSHTKKATRFAVEANGSMVSSGVKGNNLKQEINDYIQRISSPGTSVIGEESEDDATARSAMSQKDARDQLWYKLHHRYAGDREGKHTAKLQVGEYVLEGIMEDNQIMNNYDKEMEEGWNV